MHHKRLTVPYHTAFNVPYHTTALSVPYRIALTMHHTRLAVPYRTGITLPYHTALSDPSTQRSLWPTTQRSLYLPHSVHCDRPHSALYPTAQRSLYLLHSGQCTLPHSAHFPYAAQQTVYLVRPLLQLLVVCARTGPSLDVCSVQLLAVCVCQDWSVSMCPQL